MKRKMKMARKAMLPGSTSTIRLSPDCSAYQYGAMAATAVIDALERAKRHFGRDVMLMEIEKVTIGPAERDPDDKWFRAYCQIDFVSPIESIHDMPEASRGKRKYIDA